MSVIYRSIENERNDWLNGELFDFLGASPGYVNALLVHCYKHKVSDICVKGGSHVYAKKNGRNFQVTKQVLDSSDALQFAAVVSKHQGIGTILKSSTDYDTAYEVDIGDRTFIRFRVNITSIGGNSFNTAIVMRSIPDKPPKVEELGVEDELFQNFFPATGLVLVTGPTGSGKSTLLASILRYMIEEKPCKIGTYEAPIEFNLMGLDKLNSSFVTQCEVGQGRNIKTFEKAAANALRCAHDVVLLGESRDFATIRGLAELSEQGTMTYTTMHTNSSYDVFSRIIATMGEENRAVLLSFISSLRMVVHQRLYRKPPNEDGSDAGRVALREYFILDEECRRELILAPPDKITHVAKDLNRTHGRLLSVSAEEALERGDLTEDDYKRIRAMRE